MPKISLRDAIRDALHEEMAGMRRSSCLGKMSLLTAVPMP